MYKKHAFRLFAALLVIPVAAAAAPGSEASESLRSALESPATRCPSLNTTIDPAARQRLVALYEPADFAPLWTRYERLDPLLEQLQALANDGLEPSVYGPDRIRRAMQTATADPLHRECADIQASHAYLLALDHLAHGRLPQDRFEPVWRSPNAAAQQQEQDRMQAIARAGLDDVAGAFDAARPALEHYHNLRTAFARLRQAPQPTWLPLPPGKTLRPGMQDPRLPLLRQRLSAEGLLLEAAGTDASPTYGDPDIAAVKAFQARHALQDDGIVGTDTLAALNASQADRLGQLRVNLERMRWMARDIEPRSLLVDIAGGRVIYFREGEPRWEARTQVGRETRQTPSIKSNVTRLTLNPTWTIPPTIQREDKLPKIRADIAYLAEQGLQVIDYDGNVLDPRQIDWANPGDIMLRQAAGPDNPLGRVVIRFANPYSIYLHDTPSQGLFSRSQRAFSSGCVRVESIMQLVDLLLTEAERERVSALLERGDTYEFRLARPTPVLLGYWTAEADRAGTARYRPDIYHRDPALLAALRNADQDAVLD